MLIPVARALRVGLLSSLSLALACATKTAPSRGTDAGTPDASSPGLDARVPEPLGDFAGREPDELFDPEQVRTFELRLSEADLARLDADPMAEEYVPGELIFEGARVEQVGIRYKGSQGSFVGCLDGGFFPPSGAKSCPKLSLKIKIDFVAEDAKFFGQKKLLFHAMNLDRSLLRERLGYALYDELGVFASRTAHVRLLVNGELSGLYLLVEEVDGRFTRERFADGGKGNLYKEAWPAEQSEAYFIEALETNRDEQPSAAKMAAFGSQLARANDATLPSVVNRWLDVDYAARFVAVDRTIRHDDGPYHWYCGPATDASSSWRSGRPYAGLTCGNHNYYWYESSESERLWPIPWDLDNAMPERDGFTTVRSAWDDLSYDCTEPLDGIIGPQQMPVTCDPLQRGFALALRERVHAAMRELGSGPLADAALDARIARLTEQLEPFVAEAAAAHPREPGVVEWRLNVSALRDTLARLRDEALAQAESPDGGVDAGSAAESDAGQLDASVLDAGVLDAGTRDASAPDAGTGEDAGASHPVVDAGASDASAAAGG